MSKYQTYPEYKGSGVEWLAEIPAHWKTCRLKHLASIKNGQDYKTVQSEVGYPVMGSGGQFAFAKEFMYDKPSVLLGRKGTIDKPLYINEPFWTVDTMYYTEMQPETDAKYLYYLATTIQFARYSTNTALPSMTQEHLGNYTFAVPVEVSDRNQIANFLDHETAKIDTLIEKQQQLIKLLKEKRQAVVSHAVTKGLNPHAPMKDSGVEWLGEVPEHWGVTRLKYECSEIVDCPHSTPQYSDDGVYLAIRTADIHVGFLDVDKARRVTENVYHQRNLRLAPKSGDIIYSREGERYGIGALVPENTNVCLAQRVMLFRAKDTPEFLMWAVNSQAVYKQAQQDVIGATAPHVNVVTIKNFSLAWPPKEEREEISNHIRRVTSLMDELILVSSKKMRLLQERRTALISAAVTGKIDVRNWQAPTSEYQAMEQTA